MFQLRPYQQKLIDDVKKAIVDGYKAPCIVSPAGSGKTVVLSKIIKGASLKGNHTLFLVHRREILDQVEETLVKMGVDMDYVELGMVQTIVRRLDTTKKPTMIVVDESHHIVSNSYKKIINHFNEALVISFTATPVRLGGSGLGDVNDILIEGATVKWLIENNYLAPYKYYAPKLIDTGKLKLNNLREFSKSSIDEVLGERRIYGDVIKHYKKLADGEQAIVYAHSVEFSKQVASEFTSSGIDARHIDGKTNKDERDNIVREFKEGKIKILTNVDLIGEGVNVPDCSTVIMLRPTKSLSLYIQQSMRGMRYKPNKTSIIIDHVGNVLEHGLPDDEHEWSLDGKFKAKSNTSDDGMLIVRQCETCFAVYESKLKVCPQCGTEMQVTEQELKNIKEIELEEIKRKQKEKSDEIVLDFDTPNDCKNLQELQAYARRKGYKNGWAWYQAKTRGFIK